MFVNGLIPRLSACINCLLRQEKLLHILSQNEWGEKIAKLFSWQKFKH